MSQDKLKVRRKSTIRIKSKFGRRSVSNSKRLLKAPSPNPKSTKKKFSSPNVSKLNKSNKVSIPAVKEAIDTNYFLHKKWTIIKDSNEYCAKNYLPFRSTVIEMDDLDDNSGEYISQILQSSVKKGYWVTFSFKKKQCCLEEYIEKKIVPYDIMCPNNVVESQSPRGDLFKINSKNSKMFRIVFVVQEGGYSQFMLDHCVLISIDNEGGIKDNKKHLTRILSQPELPPSANVNHRLEMVQACFDGNYSRVKEMMDSINSDTDNSKANESVDLLQKALKGRLQICEVLVEKNSDTSQPKRLTTSHNDKVNSQIKPKLQRPKYKGSLKNLRMFSEKAKTSRNLNVKNIAQPTYLNKLENKVILSKWNSTLADQMSKFKIGEQNELQKSFLNCKEMDPKMKQKLKEYLIERTHIGDYEAIHKLVSADKASVETQDELGRSLLNLAIINNKSELATNMIQELGADVNSKDDDGCTPLMHAAFNGNLQICKLLVFNGADVDAKNFMNVGVQELASTPEVTDFINRKKHKLRLNSGERLRDLVMSSTNFYSQKSIDTFSQGDMSEVGSNLISEELDEDDKTNHTKVKLDSFSLIKVIGVGAFGRVFLAKDDQGNAYAMKRIRKDKILKSDAVDNILLEHKILSQIHHPLLLGLKHAFSSEHRFYFFTDFVLGSDLMKHIKKNKKGFTLQQVKFIGAQIVLALECLHDKNIVHRDLKPENVLIDEEGYIKLADFGLAKNLDEGLGKGSIGTLEYMAPEVLDKDIDHNKEVDWWTLGILLYELYYGRSPFYGATKMIILDNIKYLDVQFPDSDEESNSLKSFKSLVKKLLKKDPTKRLGHDLENNGADIVKKHSFFKKIEWAKILDKSYEAPYIPKINADKVNKYLKKEGCKVGTPRVDNDSENEKLCESDIDEDTISEIKKHKEKFKAYDSITIYSCD